RERHGVLAVVDQLEDEPRLAAEAALVVLRRDLRAGASAGDVPGEVPQEPIRAGDGQVVGAVAPARADLRRAAHRLVPDRMRGVDRVLAGEATGVVSDVLVRRRVV